MRSNIISIIVGLILTAAVLFLSAIPSETSKLLVTRMNYIAYDLILSSLSPGKVPKNNNVVIVDIDDKSLQEIGRWPWHRDVLAGLIKKLQNDGAVVIALDVIFPEYEDNIVEKILNSQKNNSSFDEQVKTNLLKVKPLFDYDNILSDTLSASDTVVGVFFEANKGHYAGHLTNEWLSISKDFSSNLLIPRMENYTSSNYKIVAGAKNLGSVTTIPDEDGVIRRTPLLFHYNNKIYPSLALEAVKLYYLVDKPRIVFAPAARFNAVLGIDLNTVYIPTDASGRMFVPFVGKGYTFPYFSAADVIKNRIKKGTFSEKLVFIGISSTGLGDNHSVPLQSSAFPGVEVHANVASAIMNKNFITSPAWTKGLEFVILFFLGVILSSLFPWLLPRNILLIGVLTIAGLIYSNVYIWKHLHIILPNIVLPVLLVILISVWNSVYSYFVESQIRKRIQHMFGQYVPKEHVNMMVSSHDKFEHSGETKTMTVLFTDIRNFTSISEKLDANGVKSLLNLVFTELTEVIFKYNGTIDKYVGDMLMAFWGAPIADEKHAEHAVSAGLEMLKKVEDLKDRLEKANLPAVAMGIGINTGIMHVGDMGSKYRLAYTVLGDSVNLGSRLESLTKFYCVKILVSESVKKLNNNILFRFIDRVRVKGKSVAVNIYEPICYLDEASSELLSEIDWYNNAIEMYFNKKWNEAKDQFEALSQLHKNINVYTMFSTRSIEYIANPPDESWDGVYVRDAK